MNSSNKKIARNSLYLYIRTFFTIIVSLYTSRIFLQLLGFEDYGIYNLVAGIIAFLAILKGFLSSAIQRFLNIEIGKNNKYQENKIFDVSIIINLGIIFLFLIIAETIGLWFVVNILNIPTGKENLTIWVYQIAILTASVTMLSMPYNAYIIAHECMDFFAWISVLEVTSKLCITFILVFFQERLIPYSLLILLIYIIITILNYMYCHKKISMQPFRWYSPTSNIEYRQILSFSIWTVVGNGASIARDQGISVVFNLFKGVTLNAAMGIVTQISNIYSTLFTNIQTAFLPQIVQNVNTNSARYRQLLSYCCLLSFLLMTIVCLPMVANADFVLHLWLGRNIPDYTVIFVQIIMIKILIVSSSQPIYASLVAAGKIKEIQILYVLFSSIALGGTYLLLYADYNPAIALILVVLMDSTMLTTRLFFMSKYTSMSAYEIIKSMWKPYLIVFLVYIPFCFWISTLQQNWNCFLSSTIIITILNIFLIYFSIDEKLRKMIQLKFNEIIPK